MSAADGYTMSQSIPWSSKIFRASYHILENILHREHAIECIFCMIAMVDSSCKNINICIYMCKAFV